MKAVDYFMLTSFGFIFAALIEYIIVLNSPNAFLDACFCCNKEDKDDTTQNDVRDMISNHLIKFMLKLYYLSNSLMQFLDVGRYLC